MQTRPHIQVKLSRFDKLLEWIGKLMLCCMWALILYVYFKMPAVIPVHYNAAGQADGYGNKATLFLLPFFATLIYVGFTWLCKQPHLFNYPVNTTSDNAEQQYTITLRMLRWLKVAILIVFTLIILLTYFTTTGVTNGLGGWFLPVTLALILIPVIVSIIQLVRKR